jgi:ATP-dependent DNA ligase
MGGRFLWRRGPCPWSVLGRWSAFETPRASALYPAMQPPTGETWLHEIKHDGFRIIARKDGARVRLYSRPSNDLTDRFPL